jgi:hypothetical protein
MTAGFRGRYADRDRGSDNTKRVEKESKPFQEKVPDIFIRPKGVT